MLIYEKWYTIAFVLSAVPTLCFVETPGSSLASVLVLPTPLLFAGVYSWWYSIVKYTAKDIRFR